VTEEAIGTTPHLEYMRPPADRFVRRLLRVGDAVDKTAVFGARRSTTTAIVVSGIRCTITYLLIPILAPFVGLLEALDAPVSILLSSFAIVMGISGVRRFWIADHRARWSYTAFIGLVLVMLSVAIAFDLSKLVNS
jgi:MFS-type transporter involved in bile tolerance (Atg22 family)